MMIGIGVDLCEVSRIEEAIKKAHFFERIYTAKEREYILSKGKTGGASAAAMFAAKEAVAKALKTGFSGGVAPWLIEVTHDGAGAPGVNLMGGAQERLDAMGGGRVMLSLSHEGNTAIAFAMIEAE